MRLKDIIHEVNRGTSYDITMKTRKRPIVYARAVYIILAIELMPKESLVSIGREVGLTHATVIHVRDNMMDTIMNYEPYFVDIYNKVRMKLLQKNKEILKDKYECELSRTIAELEELKTKYNELISYDDEIIRSINTIPSDRMDLFKVRLDAMITMIKA